MKSKSVFQALIALLIGIILSHQQACNEGKDELPSVITSNVTDISQTRATSGGDITSEGSSAVTARGICWSKNQDPTIMDDKTTVGSGAGSFISTMTDLTANTQYYVRAYATNGQGTAYGNEVPFTTLESGVGTITDIDGNEYSTVTIGTQVWMAENLKVTKYRNGDPIPNVTSFLEWSTLATGGYCNMSNDAGAAEVYGRLYNWHAVNDGRNIAPAGWHVATDADWTTLVNYLGGAEVAGGKMKEKGTLHWCDPNTGATNASGFTALPGGTRSWEYDFLQACYWGCWWSATISTDSTAYNRNLFNSETSINRVDNNMKFGMSVRCVMD